MSIEELQKQSNINIQEKANLIWEIATHLYGEYKPHEYGKVILPMTVIKRFDDALKNTKQAVVDKVKELDNLPKPVVGSARDAILKATAKHDFYNFSRFDFAGLIADSENIKENFITYLQSFSDNVKDIIQRFDFFKEIDKMSENDLLFTIINEFNAKKADFSPSIVTAQDMGYIFEELIRKFSESYDEQAGAHFTARDIIYLMTELLIANDKEELQKNGGSKTAYDMTMGTSQMLACLDERLKSINERINLSCFGQEFNPETYAIAKADMLIKGGDADNMKFGDTLSNDQFPDYTFDYIISNPPFGIDWKKEEKSVKEEHSKQGYNGRFGPGLPQISDGQLLFMLNGIKKLKEGHGRMAIIQNGSSLFNGDAGSGPSEIRKYIIENDLLEAIIQLPMDLFYNTGIATYIWVITKNKESRRLGKVQLIDASKCFRKRKKGIGKKKNDLTDECIKLILDTYNKFEAGYIGGDDFTVESQIYNNEHFGFSKITICSPMLDLNNKPVLKKGKFVADKDLNDVAIIPLDESIESYLEKYIRPYKPYCFVDESRTKIGYEIPFTRFFYKFSFGRPAIEIYNELKKIQKEESTLFEKLFEDMDDEK